MKLEKLVKEYHSLWIRHVDEGKIVDFCRQHLQVYNPKNRSHVATIRKIWDGIPHLNYRLFRPSFLKHLREDDGLLLKVLGECFCDIYIYVEKPNSEPYQVIQNILLAKDEIPANVRAHFWLYYGIYNIPDGFTPVPRNCVNLTGFDKEIIRSHMIQNKIPGYLRIPVGIRLAYRTADTPYELTPHLAEAIQKDSYPMFEIARCFSDQELNRGILCQILKNGSTEILCNLLQENLKKITKILSAKNILFYLCYHLNKEENVLPIIDDLEKQFPGICKSVDQLGNTALWYCLIKNHGGKQALVQKLMEYGCDPNHLNHLNLSYRICTAALSEYKKNK